MTMRVAPHRFDGSLESIRSDDLKRMVTVWGGKGTLRKAECIEVIRSGLADPELARAAVAQLKPFEHAALATLERLGDEARPKALALALLAAGAHLTSGAPSTARGPDEMVRRLARRGLLLSNRSYDPASVVDHYSYSQDRNFVVFSDERIMRCIDPERMPSLDLPVVERPPTTLWRRPQAITLSLVAVLQAIDDMGGLSLTQAGAVRVADRRKLVRAMQWDDVIDIDGLPFPDPFDAFTGALEEAGLLTVEFEALEVADPVHQTSRRPYHEQVGGLLIGFLRASGWAEWKAESGRWYSGTDCCNGRVALTVALAALPHEEQGFFTVQRLSDELFTRIGEHFSLGYAPGKPRVWPEDKEKERRLVREWREERKASWSTRERKWIEAALSTWLYALGMVELGFDGRELVSFRLTQLGRDVLHPHLAAASATPAEGAPEAWVVQPNFDVVVYLDRATPAQLAFIERHAERADAGRHMAQYRLTRNSIYRGLESGTCADELVETLQAGSQAELPQNVLVDLGEWAAAREQIVVRRKASLLQFATEDARHAALDSGTVGKPVGSRLLLLDGQDPAHGIGEGTDYAQPLPKCLSVTEEGRVRLETGAPDLLVHGQVDRFAERVEEGCWKLTASSVSGAIGSGVRAEALLDLLGARVTKKLPAMLEISVRAWAGETFTGELESVTILRCRDPEAFRAIAKSRKCRPYIVEVLGPDSLVVDTERLEELKAVLDQAGLQVCQVRKTDNE